MTQQNLLDMLFDSPQSFGRKVQFVNPYKSKVTFRALKFYLTEESDLLSRNCIDF